MIADCVVEQCTQLAAIATKGKKVVSNKGIRRTGLQPCNHEKADTRILPYTQDDVRSGFKKVMIAANDTDVVISLYALFDLGRDELWIEYGSGKQQRWLPIHTYASVLLKKYAWHFRFGMLLPAVTQLLCFQEWEKRQRGKLGTVFQSLHCVL